MIRTSSVLAYTLVLLCVKASLAPEGSLISDPSVIPTLPGALADLPVAVMLEGAADNVVYCEFFHEITIVDHKSTPLTGGNIKGTTCSGFLISGVLHHQSRPQHNRQLL